MLVYVIAAEVTFWILLLGGLCCRYILRLNALSAVLLIATPVVDLAVVMLTYIDLNNGSPSDFAHGLAAFYVGFSVIFGPDIIRRMDRRFAFRYGGLDAQSAAPLPPRTTMAQWRRCLVASTITLGLLAIGLLIVDLSHAFWLIYWMIVMVFTAVTWGIIGPWRAARKSRSQGEKVLAP